MHQPLHPFVNHVKKDVLKITKKKNQKSQRSELSYANQKLSLTTFKSEHKHQ